MLISILSKLDPTVMDIQGQGVQAGSQNSNVSVPSLNWKAKQTC